MRRSLLVNIGLAGTIVATGIGGWVAINDDGDSVDTSTNVVEATEGIVLASVTDTGTVSSAEDVGVDFQQTGRIASISVAVGDVVDEGNELARVDDTLQQASLASASASYESAQAQLSALYRGPTATEQAQNEATLNQAQRSIESARTSLEHAQETAVANVASYQAQVDEANAALDQARVNAELNATDYDLQIDQAEANVDNAEASAQQNAANYDLQIDQAEANVDNAEASAQQNAANYDLQIDQAEDNLAAAQQDVTDAQGDLDQARSNLSSLQASADPSGSSTTASSSLISRYRSDQSLCQANASDPSYAPPDGVDCDQAGSLLSLAQDLQSAEGSLDQAQDSVRTAQNSLDSAERQRTSGLVQDQQNIDSAEQAVDNARRHRSSGLVQDQQSIDSAELAVRTAQQSRTAGLNQDQQQIADAERSVANAVLTQSSSLLQDQQQIESALGSLASAEASYESTLANTNAEADQDTPEQVAQAISSVTSAAEQLANAQRNVDDTVLRAPVGGTVASIDGIVGDYASSGSASGDSTTTAGFVVLSDLDALQVDVSFTESDATKVEVGQQATITVDAIGDESYSGRLVDLSFTSTESEGVVTYDATIVFDDAPGDVRSGMTADVEVVLDRREDVVTLPTSAVPSSGNTATVSVQAEDGTEEQREVGIGLRGDNAVEITTGLESGEQVVVTTETGAAGGGFPLPGGGGGLGGGGIGGGGPAGGGPP